MENPSEDAYLLHAKRMIEKQREKFEQRENVLKEINEVMQHIETLNIAFQNDYTLFSQGQDDDADDLE